MQQRHLILAVALLAASFFSPVYAQETISIPVTYGDENGLMSGGGDGGTQFPEGTENCSGSRRHHAHGYPGRFTCSKQVNPHYSITDGSMPCTQRSKDECGCEDCCRKQTSETKNCFCGTSSACKAGADYALTVCKGTCLSNYLGTCSDPNFTEPGPGQG